MIVADANLWIALLLEHERSHVAQAVFDIDPEWHVPIVCLSEVRNAGLAYVRRELITPEHLVDALGMWRGLARSSRRHDADDLLLVDRAVASGCTAYDCEYLVVAQVLDVPLLTWDKQVLRVFPDVAVTPEWFVGSGD